MNTKLRHDITRRAATTRKLAFAAPGMADMTVMDEPPREPLAPDLGKLIGLAALPKGNTPIPVLIEVQQRPLRLSLRGRRPLGGTVPELRVPPDALPRTDTQVSMLALQRVHHRLSSMHLAHAPVVLQDARVISAELTGEQIGAVLAMPEVAAVRPNPVYRSAR